MKKSLLLSLLFVTSSALAGTPAPEELARSSNAFGWSLFAQMQQKPLSSDNILFSPLSAWLALTLASNGAEQQTLAEMRRVLHTDASSLIETNQAVNEYINRLLGPTPTGEVLSLAHSVWGNSDQFELAAKFQSDAATFYSILPAEDVARSASFARPETLDQINGWVNKSTRGMIPDILKQLDPDMAVILLNALFFQAQWLQPFQANFTSAADFHCFDGSTQTAQMMRASAAFFPFASDGTYKMLSLAFRAGTNAQQQPELGRFQLDLVIPENEGDSVLNLNQARYEKLVTALRKQAVGVSVPRFRFSSENALTDGLTRLGMQRAFQPGRAQMLPLGTPKLSGDSAFISNVLQKTAVEMDESGFKAAAVTAVIASTTAMPHETASFIADRPFFLALRHRETGALLFQGIVGRP